MRRQLRKLRESAIKFRLNLVQFCSSLIQPLWESYTSA